MKASSFRHPAIMATLCLALLGGCASYPDGMTRAEWQKLKPGEQAMLLSREKKQTQAFERTKPQEGPVLRETIADDQRNRDRAPVLTER